MCSLVVVTEIVVVVTEVVAVTEVVVVVAKLVVVAVEFVKIKISVAINVPIKIAASIQQNKHNNKQSRLNAGRFLKTKIEPRNRKSFNSLSFLLFSRSIE